MHEEHNTRLNDVRKLIDILIRLVGAFSCQVQLTKHHETRGGTHERMLLLIKKGEILCQQDIAEKHLKILAR